MVSKTRQKERRSKALELAREVDKTVNETLENKSDHSNGTARETIGNVLNDPTPLDNEFVVLSQRVDERIKTGLRDTLEQFECRLSAAIGELREVVSLSISDSLKAQSIGGSGEGPSCPRVINPVEERTQFIIQPNRFNC